jgi:hypothetical protein
MRLSGVLDPRWKATTLIHTETCHATETSSMIYHLKSNLPSPRLCVLILLSLARLPQVFTYFSSNFGKDNTWGSWCSREELLVAQASSLAHVHLQL